VFSSKSHLEIPLQRETSNPVRTHHHGTHVHHATSVDGFDDGTKIMPRSLGEGEEAGGLPQPGRPDGGAADGERRGEDADVRRSLVRAGCLPRICGWELTAVRDRVASHPLAIAGIYRASALDFTQKVLRCGQPQARDALLELLRGGTRVQTLQILGEKAEEELESIPLETEALRRQQLSLASLEWMHTDPGPLVEFQQAFRLFVLLGRPRRTPFIDAW
jgi:hypothetical protein